MPPNHTLRQRRPKTERTPAWLSWLSRMYEYMPSVTAPHAHAAQALLRLFNFHCRYFHAFIGSKPLLPQSKTPFYETRASAFPTLIRLPHLQSIGYIFYIGSYVTSYWPFDGAVTTVYLDVGLWLKNVNATVDTITQSYMIHVIDMYKLLYQTVA